MVLLYRNDVQIYSGLVSLYMHFDRHTYETSLSTVFEVIGFARNHIASALPFKVSPMIPLDPIQTLY